MTVDLELKVLSGVDRNDRSEPQGEGNRTVPASTAAKAPGSATCGATNRNRKGR